MVTVSQLHKRLSHLVNYSSQLIFVSGDSMACQQKILNEFLSGQQESTEISFFTASKDKHPSTYRSEICRQLAGHEVGSFVRPLQQLLSEPSGGLLDPSGCYLVCITQSQNLESSFLQELWDWVMHAKQVNPDIHLNVILFGESKWAKASQEWLPTQNSHKPVLLSSELVNPVGFDVNALEALIADKTSWFGVSNQPLVSNKWFISGVLTVFLVVFVSLMGWQYPAQFSHTIASLIPGVKDSVNENSAAIAGNTNKVQSELVNSTPKIQDNKRHVIVDEQLFTAINQPIDNEASSGLSTSSTISNVSILNTSPALTDIPAIDSPSITDSLLVSNWGDSVATSDQRIQQTISEQPQLLASQPLASKFSVSPLSPIQQASEPSGNSAIATNNTDGDFQVPDIISVEQLDAQFSVSPNINLAIDISDEPEIATKLSQPQQKLSQVQQIPLLSNSTIDYRFDETTLLSLPTFSVVLQLSGIQNPLVLENYLNNNNLKASTWVYETQRYGGPWYVVLYRQSFESVEAALQQLSSLPADVKEAQPFAKSINQIQQEISQR